MRWIYNPTGAIITWYYLIMTELPPLVSTPKTIEELVALTESEGGEVAIEVQGRYLKIELVEKKREPIEYNEL